MIDGGEPNSLVGAFGEDLEHLYFTCVGILICAISSWQAALFAAILTVACRASLRYLDRRHTDV